MAESNNENSSGPKLTLALKKTDTDWDSDADAEGALPVAVTDSLTEFVLLFPALSRFQNTIIFGRIQWTHGQKVSV